MVLSADGMTACFQRHDVIAGGIGKHIKQRIEGTVFQIFHGGDNGSGPVFAHPLRGQGLELGDQVGAARRPARLAPGQVDPGFEFSDWLPTMTRAGKVSGKSAANASWHVTVTLLANATVAGL